MANRYWVGGTGSWDGTAGTKWSATSGGAGGASVPTSADDVFFDAASGAAVVTIAVGNTGAKSITCTGFTGTLTGSANITVSGGVTLVAGMTYTYTGTMTFNGTGTLISAGKTFGSFTVDGSGITLTLGDALTATSGVITVTQGTFNTANFAVTALLLLSSGSLTRTISLGSSTVTLSSSISLTPTTNLTFNAGTSQINLTSFLGSITIDGALTFNNVSFTSTLAGTRTLNGGATFNNLTVTASATGLSTLEINSNQTVSGTLTCAGTSATQRAMIRSSVIGTTRTITAAAISAADCDFRDITLAGAAAGASPTRAGNCGGNSGITFPAAKTVYRVGTDTTWPGSSSWATSSGGTGANTNFPLAQDTAIIDNSTTLSGTLSISTQYNMPALNCSTRTNSITIAFSINSDYHGSFALGSGVTPSSVGVEQRFVGRNTMDFTSAGKTIPFPITVTSSGGTFRLLDALSLSVPFTLNVGTLNLNSFALTATTFQSISPIGSRTIGFGTGGSIVLTASGTVWNMSNSTALATTGTGTISCSNASAKTFTGADLTYTGVTLNNAGAGALTITGSNTFEGLSNSVQPTTFTFTAGTTTTVNTWSISGTSGNLVTIGSATAASHTISKSSGTVSSDFLSISRSTATGGAAWFAGANSTDGGNNIGWIFTAPTTPTAGGNFMMMLMG